MARHVATPKLVIFSEKSLTLQEQKDIFKSLIDKYGNNSNIQNMIIDFLELNGDPEFIGHCDDCGDDIYKYTLTV